MYKNKDSVFTKINMHSVYHYVEINLAREGAIEIALERHYRLEMATL